MTPTKSGPDFVTQPAGPVFATIPPNPLLAYESANLRLIRLDPAAVERAREQYPFFQSMTIPARTHPEQPAPIDTVGIDNLLVCQQGIFNPELVYRLTKAFVEWLPELHAEPPVCQPPRSRLGVRPNTDPDACRRGPLLP